MEAGEGLPEVGSMKPSASLCSQNLALSNAVSFRLASLVLHYSSVQQLPVCRPGRTDSTTTKLAGTANTAPASRAVMGAVEDMVMNIVKEPIKLHCGNCQGLPSTLPPCCLKNTNSLLLRTHPSITIVGL